MTDGTTTVTLPEDAPTAVELLLAMRGGDVDLVRRLLSESPDLARARKSESSKLLVKLPLELRLQRRDLTADGLVGGANAAPVSRAEGERRTADRDAAEWQQPGEQVESTPGRSGKDRLPELCHELRLDLAPRVAGADPAADERLDPLCLKRVGT